MDAVPLPLSFPRLTTDHETTTVARMSDSAYSVETTSRLAQRSIENLASCTNCKSDPFKIGKWNWHLAVEKNRTLFIKLYPEILNITRDNPPIASFVIRVICSVGDCKALIHLEITDKQLKNNEDFVWPIGVPLPATRLLPSQVKFSNPPVTEGQVGAFQLGSTEPCKTGNRIYALLSD